MKVLVAIDNRPSSQATIDALIKMHWYEGTEVVLLTVLPPDSPTNGADGEPTAAFEEVENVAVELRNALRDCEVSFFARSGDPSTVIMEFAAQMPANLIVIGSNCKSTLERLLLGSVSQSVLNSAEVPVIVAKTPCCLAREASPAFRTILVPVDNSVFSDVAVDWLSNFRWGPGTKFIVAAVVSEDTDIESVRQSLGKRAGNLAKLLNTNNIFVEIATGEAHQSIIEMAKEHYADLIVMGSHGHTGLKKMILGSVSHAVTHSAPCAVAVVRRLDTGDHKHSAGEFPKLKKAEVYDVVGGYREDEPRRDSSSHSMPGGF